MRPYSTCVECGARWAGVRLLPWVLRAAMILLVAAALGFLATGW